MIGKLPKAIRINDTDYPIRSDFHVALLIFQAFNDPDLDDWSKAEVAVKCLYDCNIPADIYWEAVNKAYWFLDGGDTPKSRSAGVKLFDWEQDESIIFPSINKVAGCETREKEYLHWWTFLGYFNEVGEGLLSTVLNIRNKKSKGIKLEKYEQQFYLEHKEMIDLKKRYTEDEQAEIQRLKELLC